jgi:hypothetical protein
MNSTLTNHWNAKEIPHFCAPPGVCRGIEVRSAAGHRREGPRSNGNTARLRQADRSVEPPSELNRAESTTIQGRTYPHTPTLTHASRHADCRRQRAAVARSGCFRNGSPPSW